MLKGVLLKGLMSDECDDEDTGDENDYGDE